ncbi:hypothetical protein F4677DRAFT_440917 [Hypoxylon crocopeplum]|nr:hypothetical protein F4677DRAFT_440917 [Hypoxylon crocopeplum]
MSAVGIGLRGTLLSARLRAEDGSQHNDAINLDAVVQNMDGNLAFLEPREKLKRNIIIPLCPQQSKATTDISHLRPPSCNEAYLRNLRFASPSDEALRAKRGANPKGIVCSGKAE